MITAIVAFRDWSIERLSACVGAVLTYPQITEVIVVDFGSSTPLEAADTYRVVRVEADTWCLSEANNIGIVEAHNDFVLKIDADVRFGLDGAVLDELIQKLTKQQASFFNIQVTDVDSFDTVTSNARLRPSWGEGACNLFARADVIEIGGFDTRYFDYGGEDNDLCKRLRHYGKVVVNYAGIGVLHQRHAPSAAQVDARFTPALKERRLTDATIFRSRPFRFSDYSGATVFGPAVTVAIATTHRYGRAEQLEQCLRAYERQTFQDFEIRICENGSPREEQLSQEMLRQQFPELKIFVHQLADPSIPKARNVITANAAGFYIAVQDDDDISFPARLEEQLACLGGTIGAHGCHSSWVEFDEASSRLSRYKGKRRNIHTLMHGKGKITLHSTGFYRKDVLERFAYDESMGLGSDYDLCMRMTLAGLKVPHTQRFHCLRRLHASSVSSGGQPEQRDVSRQTNNTYRAYLGEAFLMRMRERESKEIWPTGFPTRLEMMGLLPPDFGAFRIVLTLENAVLAGLDPIFEPGDCTLHDIAFEATWQGLGKETLLIVQSQQNLNAGEILKIFPRLACEINPEVISITELNTPQYLCSLQDLEVVEKSRVVASRRLETMEDVAAVLNAVAEIDLGEHKIGLFAVNDPVPGLHVLLGSYRKRDALRTALRAVDATCPGLFAPYANRGLSGDFW